MPQIALKSRYTKTYDEGITQAVGPTTATGQRPSRSELAPDDFNSFFAAPNGDDLNPGTEALPFLTIAFGLAALTGPQPNLILIRNAYVGDLIWTSSATYTIPAGMNLQVEEGEIAYLHMDGVSPQVVLSAASKADGFEVLHNWTVSTGGNLVDIAADSCVVTNCQFGKTIPGNEFSGQPAVVVGSSGGITSLQFNHCSLVFDNAKLMTVPHLPGVDIRNCIYIGALTPVSGSGLEYSTPGAPPSTTQLTRCLFWGFEKAVTPYPGTVGSPNELGLAKCVVLNCTYAFGTTGSGSDYYTILPLASYLLPSTATVSDSLNVTLTITDAIDTDIPPLFIDQAAGQAGSPSGWRIQMAGRLVDGTTSRYLISSPLYQVLGGSDADPWDEFVTLTGASYLDTVQFSPNTPAEATINIDPQGSVQLYDINGNLYADYDGIKKIFELKWLAAPRISDSNDVRRLNQIMIAKGTKLFYPLGLTGNLFQPVSMAGTFSGGSLEVDIVADQYYDMIPGWWIGWWLELDGKDWYIIDNDESVLYLANPLGNSLPADANYSLAVRYMIVQNMLAPLIMSQGGYYTRFAKGGQIAEKEDSDILPFEWQGWTAKFAEVSTSRER